MLDLPRIGLIGALQRRREQRVGPNSAVAEVTKRGLHLDLLG
jgi:hypothetical protein